MQAGVANFQSFRHVFVSDDGRSLEPGCRCEHHRSLNREVASASRTCLGDHEQAAGGDHVDPATGAADLRDLAVLPRGEVAHGGVRCPKEDG